MKDFEGRTKRFGGSTERLIIALGSEAGGGPGSGGGSAVGGGGASNPSGRILK